uniref:Uncharacterized protein n=1 Tax=Arion vulgaris TaxID=1028688 RepID=A0A0B6Z9C9_9EUPU
MSDTSHRKGMHLELLSWEPSYERDKLDVEDLQCISFIIYPFHIHPSIYLYID